MRSIHTKGPSLVARESAATYEAAIDRLLDKLERQVERYRDKRTLEQRRRGAALRAGVRQARGRGRAERVRCLSGLRVTARRSRTPPQAKFTFVPCAQPRPCVSWVAKIGLPGAPLSRSVSLPLATLNEWISEPRL